MKHKYLSFDIGGTNIKYGIFDNKGNINFSYIINTPDSLDEFIVVMNKIIDKYRTEVVGVAFSLPGRIDQIENIIYGGGYLTYLHGKSLDQILDIGTLNFAMENDAKAAVLAEKWLGELKDIKNGGIVVLGTGIGGGLVLDDNIYRGKNYSAGELSILLSNKEPEIRNLSGFTGSAVEMIKQINSYYGVQDTKNGIKAFNLVKNGEAEAVKIFDEYCQMIAMVIFNMQVMLDLETVVVTGGITKQSIVLKTINDHLDKYFELHEAISKTIFKPQLVLSNFGSQANLYGALYNLLLKLEKNIEDKIMI